MVTLGSMISSSSVTASIREDLAAVWSHPLLALTVSASYSDLITSAGSTGGPVKVDFSEKSQYAATVLWNKIGVGTQALRAIDATNSNNVLFEIASLASGENDVVLASLPGWASGIQKIKLQVKSSNILDTPDFQGCSLRLK